MLYLGFALIRYVLIYNLHFSLNISSIKFSLYSKNWFFPYFWLFASNARQLYLYSISLKGSSHRESTVVIEQLVSKL